MVKIARLDDALSEMFEMEASSLEGQSLQQKDQKKQRKDEKKNFKYQNFDFWAYPSKNV